MVKPVNPVNPLNGEGSEKYNPNQKRGPSEFDKALEKEKAERARSELNKMAEETKAKAEAERSRTYAERLQDMGYYNKSSKGGGGGGSGGADMPPGFMPGKKGGQGPIDYKKGGKVSSASYRADGIAKRGKTKGRLV